MEKRYKLKNGRTDLVFIGIRSAYPDRIRLRAEGSSSPDGRLTRFWDEVEEIAPLPPEPIQVHIYTELSGNVSPVADRLVELRWSSTKPPSPGQNGHLIIQRSAIPELIELLESLR